MLDIHHNKQAEFPKWWTSCIKASHPGWNKVTCLNEWQCRTYMIVWYDLNTTQMTNPDLLQANTIHLLHPQDKSRNSNFRIINQQNDFDSRTRKVCLSAIWCSDEAVTLVNEKPPGRQKAHHFREIRFLNLQSWHTSAAFFQGTLEMERGNDFSWKRKLCEVDSWSAQLFSR